MALKKFPGFIDVHVHLREPGATHKEDFDTGTAAALAGGFVFVLDMPNNPEQTISREALDKKISLAKEKAHCGVGFIFGADPKADNTMEFEKVINDVYALKIYMDTTTGDMLLKNPLLLDKTFASWPSHRPIVVHAEEDTMNTAINLAKKYRKKLHIAHISQRSELERIINEKEHGMDITCEVTPHHLYLTEKDAKALGPYGLMKPMLKTRADVDFLWRHINAIDCIATDHAPHTKEEKESEHPPYGVPGLETSLPLMLTAVHAGRITIDDVVRLMHYGPKKIFGIQNSVVGNRMIEVDMSQSYTIDSKNLHTKCGWTPFEGMKVWGKIV